MNAPQRAFEGLLDRYFETTLAENPVWANHAGRADELLAWATGE